VHQVLKVLKVTKEPMVGEVLQGLKELKVLRPIED
jgi:hypothetical protein